MMLDFDSINAPYKRTFKKNNFIRSLAAVSRYCLHFKQQIFGKISDKRRPKRATENHLPRDFFDIIADGCIVYL